MPLGVWWGHFKGTQARSWAENWCSSEGQSAFLQRTILQLSNTALRSCGQKKLYCGQKSKGALLWSTFCPSSLALVCPPCFWDPAIGLSSWRTPGQISVAWGVTLSLGMTRKLHMVPGCYLDSAVSSQQGRALNSALTSRSHCFYHHFEKKVEGPLV